MIHYLYQIFHKKIKRRKLHFYFLEPEYTAYFYSDEDKILQILINLMSNAVKFTRKGFIQITASTLPDDFIEFSIQDTGEGIPPEIQDKIFEKFYQRESKELGLGIGLSVCKQLVEAMGGKIEVRSPLYGKENQPGTEISFTIKCHY